jgi:hypothetical protein
MSKELKNYISENRAEFDDQLPPASAWQQVERAIDQGKPGKQIPLRTIYKWSAAAAVFFIITVSFYYLVIKDGKNETNLAEKDLPTANEKSNGNDLSRIEPGFAAEAKKIYKSIEQRQLQLRAIAREQPELYTQFSEDLATLDSSYRVLKSQALQTPNREVIIRAMLQNLQLQAELLAKQLQILNEFKTDKTEQNEKNNSPRI